MQRVPFENNHIYHVYNRGVEKRKIYLDKNDYFRFVHDLFEFNDENPAPLLYYKLPSLKSYEVQPHRIDQGPRKLLVEVLAFCLMPNHFHLLLKQTCDNGIVKFMQKLGTGYAMYFNKKYERVGSLFQGRFKSVHIKREEHLIHMPYYIHLNPLDLIVPEWREKEIKGHRKAIKFLENYRWSSYLDYIGKKNFPSVTQRKFLSEFLDKPQEYKREMIKWLKEMDLNIISHLTLE